MFRCYGCSDFSNDDWANFQVERGCCSARTEVTDYCMFSCTVAVASLLICTPQIAEKTILGFDDDAPTINGKDKH